MGEDPIDATANRAQFGHRWFLNADAIRKAVRGSVATQTEHQRLVYS